MNCGLWAFIVLFQIEMQNTHLKLELNDDDVPKNWRLWTHDMLIDKGVIITQCMLWIL